jgi:endonuclease/exonuclease/phosphatase family metal-dependent hydrolase
MDTTDKLMDGTQKLEQKRLRVASWNLLADCYVRVQGQPWNDFAHCSDEHLCWEVRKPKIEEFIATSDADILGLQEVVFEKRDGIWQLPEWLCSAAHRGGFTAVMQEMKQKEYENNAKRNLKHVGTATPTGLTTLIRTERLKTEKAVHGSGSGIVLFLEDKSTAAKLVVANTHLVGDPSKSDGQLKQLESIQKSMRSNVPPAWGAQCARRIILGDFNNSCEEGSEVAKWLSQACFHEAATPASWAEPNDACRLDHIFFSQEAQGVRLVEVEQQHQRLARISGSISGSARNGSSSSGGAGDGSAKKRRRRRVFILAGQSNMVGRGSPDQIPEAALKAIADHGEVYVNYAHERNAKEGEFASSGKCVPLGRESQFSHISESHHFGPEIGLARQLLEVDCVSPLEQERQGARDSSGSGQHSSGSGQHSSGSSEDCGSEPLHFAKYAMGSTNLHTDWHPDGEHFADFIRFVKQSIEELKEEQLDEEQSGPECGAQPLDVELVGMCWLQGESDAGGNASVVNAYEENLVQFVTKVREALYEYSEALPVVIAQIEWQSKRTGKVNDAIARACCRADMQPAECALLPTQPMDGAEGGRKLSTLADGHQDSQSLLHTGREMGRAFQRLVDRASILATGLPNAQVPSDHLPVQIVIELCPVEAIEKEEEGSGLSVEAMQLIVAAVDEVHAGAPPKFSGRPSAEQIVASQEHGKKMKAVEEVHPKESPARSFCGGYVKALKKGKGGTYTKAAGLE